MKKAAIIYGWAEGPWESQKFRELLQENEFEITNNPSNADIIIAHSSGCYLTPSDIHNKQIFLIGLPYWPGRSLLSSIIKKLKNEVDYHRRDKSLGWWLNKILHNTWYILSRPSASYFGLTKHKEKYLPSDSNNIVMVIRPSDDTFCHPDIMKLLPMRDYKFIELPGAHDDCWVDPKPYIDLLLKEL
ncbi:MAG TPA: hypothetical protein VLE51_02685 [Candidatus Saccharimonadales bacterium]|nr:hypothetical protein [Candidatus Saccharimonadales bacterium]